MHENWISVHHFYHKDTLIQSTNVGLALYNLCLKEINHFDPQLLQVGTITGCRCVTRPYWSLWPVRLYMHARIHAFAHRQHDCYDLWMKSSCTKDSCTKGRCPQRASINLLDKASHLTAFCAWDGSPHLPVTPAQLMRPGIGWNASCAMGDFTQNLGLFFLFF